MERKFTPGPWQATPTAINSIDITTDDEKFIAGIVADNEEDLLTELEWDNARLIAAAPDLLEAVEILLNTPIDQFDNKRIEICIKARNKALGKETEG